MSAADGFATINGQMAALEFKTASASALTTASPAPHISSAQSANADTCHLCGHVINMRGNSWTMDVSRPVHTRCLKDCRGW